MFAYYITMITKHVYLNFLIGIREVKVSSNGRLYTFRGWTRHNKIDFQPCLVKKNEQVRRYSMDF